MPGPGKSHFQMPGTNPGLKDFDLGIRDWVAVAPQAG